MKGTLWAKRYCVAVALSVVAWYFALSRWPSLVSWFVGPQLDDYVLKVFVAPDIAVLVVAPLAFAFTGRRVWFDLFFFGSCYGTFATLGLCFVSSGGWLGLALMSLATLGAWAFRRRMDSDAAA